MLKKRIIPLLLILDDRFVKTINFDKFKDVGDPISTAKIFNDSDADSSASLASPQTELFPELANAFFDQKTLTLIIKILF